MNPSKTSPGPGKVKVIAHRGASGYAPENTLAAFSLAARMGVAAIELDVHLSADGEPVVIHDSRVERTTDGRGAVRNMTLAELKELDAGSWFSRSGHGISWSSYAGERIPTLQQAIDVAAEAGIGLYVEIKDPELYPEDFEDRIVSLVRRNNFESRVVLLSFSGTSIQKAKRLDALIRAALLVGRPGKSLAAAVDAVGADDLALRHTLLTLDIVREARSAGKGLTVWTADDDDAIRRALDLGVDGIITNYPDRVTRVLEEEGP